MKITREPRIMCRLRIDGFPRAQINDVGIEWIGRMGQNRVKLPVEPKMEDMNCVRKRGMTVRTMTKWQLLRIPVQKKLYGCHHSGTSMKWETLGWITQSYRLHTTWCPISRPSMRLRQVRGHGRRLILPLPDEGGSKPKGHKTMSYSTTSASKPRKSANITQTITLTYPGTWPMCDWIRLFWAFAWCTANAWSRWRRSPRLSPK